MDFLEYDSGHCSIARVLSLIGEKWTILVLRDAFNGARRFSDFQAHLGIPRPVLADRLTTLVDAGILARTPYQEPGQRARDEYRLTAQGLELRPVMVALAQWGDRHQAGSGGAPVNFEHRDCDDPVTARLVCDEGHILDEPRQLKLRPGPGARRLSA